MISSGEGSSPVGVRRIATLAVTAAVLVQCSSTPPPPVVTSPPSAASPTAHAATIGPLTAADLGPSWHSGCPIDPQHLLRVEVTYLGFDGQTHRGELIVHEDLAAEVV